MPILRSREIIFKLSIAETLEKSPPLDPSTPSNSDAMAAVTSSSTPSPSSAAAPRRRSLRLASIEAPIVDMISGRKRKARVSESPNVGEVRVLEENASMSLRSGNRIAKREERVEEEKDVEIDLQEKLDFESVVVENKLKNVVSQSPNVAKVRGLEGSVLRSGEERDVEVGLQERLDFESVVVEKKLKSVDESQLLESVTVESKGEGIKEEEAAGPVRLSYEAKGKGKMVSDADFTEKTKDEMVIDGEEKGKGKLVIEEDHSLINNGEVVFDDGIQSFGQEVLEGSPRGRRGRKAKARMTIESRKEAERKKAIELAPQFAFFKAEEGGSEEEEDLEDLTTYADQQEDWPGPFSTAMKIIRDREQMLMARELNSSSKKNDDTGIKIQWYPSGGPRFKPGKSVPSLHDLSMKVLCENAEEIESLDGVPDVLKHRLVSNLCRSRKMGSHLLSLLLSGSPTEIHLSDCSWATEGDFEGAFDGCNTEKLKVVELDLSGRCLPDCVLQATLARLPNSLPLLTMISLKGNYRLSDAGLNAIVSSAPLLSSVNLGQCSLITSAGIIALADKLESVLRELYIDDCQDVNAMLILPALMKLKHLEVLSVAGIETVGDKFVKKLVAVCGKTMKGLVFSGCRKLTAASMKVIGESCSQLYSLDLRYLNRLNDSAIGHLANGCRSIQKLKLCRNAFSDEAVAAFLEVSGGSLIELSLNNVGKVAQQTAIAISRRCSSTLKILDLSFCRNMTDEALGLITDSCSSLRTLKLFGCTQVTNLFLEGHSNPIINIVGSKGSVLDQIKVPEFL